MNRNFQLLEERLGYHFKDEEHLALALVHPSWVMEQDKPASESNERLEYLGDSVLNLAVANILYLKFPALPEGLLSKARANLISRASMTRLGTSLGLGDYLLLSKGEKLTGGRSRASSIGNAMEAIFGAIFLESGFDTARDCICHLLADCIEDTPFDHQMDDNPKGELQELLASKGYPSPVYELVESSGPPHNPVFVCRILLNGKEIATARGSRRRSAESACARAVLKQLESTEN